MKRKVALMVVNAACVDGARRMVMDLGQGEVICAVVGNYEMACAEAKKLVEEGVLMIELCGGFGTLGHAKVTEAVEGKIQVGVVRFDNHPGYDGASGDTKWM